MKTPLHPGLASLAALAVAFSPVLIAQDTSAPDQSQNTRTHESTADEHANANGSSASQPGTLEKNNSKDASSETRDSHPGMAATGSADKSATKDPTGQPGDDVKTKHVARHHHHEGGQLSDKEFILEAAQGGMTEVELGRVASEKGTSAEVKEFGSKMVTDHSKANDELKSVAEKKGVQLSPNLDAKHQAVVDKFNKLSGPAFDKAYVKDMVHDHNKDVALFQEEANSGQDPEVKDFASKTLPTLQSHQSHIKQIQGSMK